MKARFIFSLTIAVLIFATAFRIHAQAASSGPQLLITWQALDSATPSSYSGKALPSTGSQITASVEVLFAGGLSNLSSRTIYWYLDGNLIGGGVGKQTISFTAPGFAEIAALRVNINDYPGGALINTSRIQITDPKIVIAAPFPNGNFSASLIQLQAFPYFFRVSKLNKLVLQWTVNGEAVTTQENPEDLTINLGASTPANYELVVNVVATQSDEADTTAADSVTLTKASQ